MKPRKELARTPLRRKTALAAVSAAKRKTKKRTPRDTGPSAEIKALLWQRAGGRCEICGRDLAFFPFSRHHRRPRQMGGSRLPWINSLPNLLLICGSATTPGGCHERVEREREFAVVNGWIVPAGYLPTEVPALVRYGTAPTLVYLTEDGSYALGAP